MSKIYCYFDGNRGDDCQHIIELINEIHDNNIVNLYFLNTVNQ